ncbi:helix-turn-helix domain-containing protein [Flavobacterium luteolum]|uniref:helix-turn-helix domain-containing protein n=1 Tax=Flavobacterium luteolum TaxID=3003259 RepID=UPI00248DA6CC|nr:helix-turn-helix transcriptional regulator [Flavobacterium luteolum]
MKDKTLKPKADIEITHGFKSACRITGIFLILLEGQFPLKSRTETLRFRSAQDFARCLNVHPNSLNRAVKQASGLTTTAHIGQRIVSEAKKMLLETVWSISEISSVLGFEHPAHFSSFFKKASGKNPKSFREEHFNY